jgi:hypothetical protein
VGSSPAGRATFPWMDEPLAATSLACDHGGMAKGATSTIPAERLAQYDRAIATLPDVGRKGATVPYTSLNGHMFSFLTPTGSLVMRLPAGQREAFLERYDTRLHEASGTVLKDWVAVPNALLADTTALTPHLRASYDYVAGQKPKPTRRKA